MHRPDDISLTGLRQFGAGLAVLLIVLFVGVVPWLADTARPVWPWIPAALLALAAWLGPGWLRPVYRGWFPFALALAWLNTRLLLGIVFFLLITPLGALLRGLKKLQYTEVWDAGAPSYRTEVEHESGAEDLERPY